MLDKNFKYKFKVVLSVGASGGTKITTSTATVAIRTLLFGQDLNEGTYLDKINHRDK